MSDQTQSHLLRGAGLFSAGLVLGGVIGSAAMLMLASQSGKKTRTQVKESSIELRDQVSRAVQDTVALARGKAHDISKAVREETEELERRGRDALKEQKEIASQFVDAEQTAVHNIAAD